MQFERIDVECLPGERIREYPASFVFRGQHYRVQEIIDRWYEGGDRPGRPWVDYYRVKTDQGRTCILRYTSLFDAWSILVSADLSLF
ncbi:MAG: hypothetical protein ACP5G0_09040 [Desulfomonilia bacterium]